MVVRLGDALAATGDKAGAADRYKRAATYYESVRHPVMAIALWSRIQRLFPTILDVRVKLAELHAQAGHLADARREYKSVIHTLRREDQGGLAAAYERRLEALEPTPEPAPPSAPTAALKRCPHCGGPLP